MKNKIFTNKILSVFLAITLTVGMFPVFALNVTANASTSVADSKTINSWKELFSDANNRYSGSIYIDKSVYTAEEAKSTDKSNFFSDIANRLEFGKDNFGNDNFMVSLSAIGSNTEIIGYSATPTDTMLVLDLSGSMATTYTVGYNSQSTYDTVSGYDTSYIENMVDAANKAIKQLQELNRHNRVGVVLYSGNSSFGSSASSTATVVLPLDRYQAVENNFIEADITRVTKNLYNRNGNRWVRESVTYSTSVAVKTATNLKKEDGSAVLEKSKAVSGGTYIQNGLLQAYNEFSKGEDTIIPDGLIQAGTQRMPIVVLMSDGAPTTATTNYTTVGSSDAGNGGSDSDTDSVGFLTQLTASWVKAKLTEDYNGTMARFYTLGVGTSNNATATGVLNPSSSANNASGFWNTFLTNGRVNLTLPPTQTYGNSYSHTLSKLDNAVLSKNYVNEYWSASDVDSMTKAFEDIVQEIIIQSRYYGTLVTTGNYNLDGYISFVDEIGSYMEVKDVKGIHIGEGSLVTGGMFAEFVKTGTISGESLTNQEKANLETELTNAIMERFGVDGSEALVLKNSAINSGYINYNSSTGEFSNYMAWYADENNDYIEPYVENSTPNSNAKYIVKSYFYLGDVLQNHVETSMLYILVRVREDIQTGRQVVDANMPAALLPMITYTVAVEGNELNEDSILYMTNNKDEKSPACLLFEVGLKDDITPYNISEKLAGEDFRKKNGVYSFYTNRWRTLDGEEFTIPTTVPDSVYNHGLVGSTEAHFVPSLQNERYYYTSNTEILNTDGTEYTGATHPKDTGESYVHSFKFIEIVNGEAVIREVNNPITENAIADAVKGKNNNWIIPAGTPKRYFGSDVHGEDAHIHKEDADNKTNTLKWVNYPRTIYKGAEYGAQDYHVFSYLGNNGRITATPAQGIKLTKTIGTVAENTTTNTFNFDITLSDINASEVDYRLEKANGTVDTGKLRINNHKVTVALGDGDTVYITGLPEGTTYTVTEQYNPYYVGTSQNNSGIIELYTLNNVDFVNNPRGFGSLLIEKEVVHSYGTDNVPSLLYSKKFDITVNFAGAEDDLANITYPASVTKVSNTEYSFSLSSGEDVVFANIPEGITYTVTENIVNAEKGDKDYGFVLDTAESTLSGSIRKGEQAEALVVNKYQPKAVAPNITLNGVKDVVGTNDTTNTFDIALKPVNIGAAQNGTNEQPIIIGAIKDGESYTFNMSSNISYTQVGTYSYEIYEVEPTNKAQNIAYDKSFGLFSVTVTDNNVDGELEISEVVVLQQSADISGNAQSGYIITKNFNNVYMAATETFTVKKTVNGEFGVYDNHAGILFGLFDGDTPQYQGMDAVAHYYSLTGDDGIATFNLNISQDDYKTAPVTYYLREMIPMVQDRVIGMTYDTGWKYTVTIYWPEGDLKPTVTYKTYGGQVVSKDTLAINNSFDPNVFSTPDIVLKGAKFLNGGALRDGDRFTIELYITDADFQLTGHAVHQTATVTKNDNSITFSGIRFKTAGTKYLVIKEKVENQAGIVYDTTVYHVTLNVIKVEDSTGKTVLQVVETENGVLKSETIYKVGKGNVSANEINFYNKYEVVGTVTVPISVTKEINGRNLVAGEFQFGIYNQNGELVEAKNNQSNGKVEFSDLVFNQTQLGVHKYTIKEIIPNEATLIGGKYVFNGVVYDAKEYVLEIDIYDNGNGGLEKTVKLNQENVNNVNITFTNEYSANEVSLELEGLKTLAGRDLVNGEFTFLLYKTENDFAVAPNAVALKTANNGLLATNKNVGEYKVTLTFADGEEGLYYYVLKEEIPAEQNGVNYDTREYHITVVVADNGLGNLVANIQNIVCPGIESEFNATNLNFGNSYNTAPTKYQISGKKILDGRDIVENEFSFLLYKADSSFKKNGDEIETVKNNADGLFTFNEIEFNQAKDYYFVVTEKDLGEKGMVYDKTEFGIKVTVKDNGKGELEIEKVTYTKNSEKADNGIEFVNVYRDISDTGDSFDSVVWFALMLVSLLGIFVTIFAKRKACKE